MARVRAEKRYMIYRAYDADGSLLYVGMAKNAIARLHDHMHTAPWRKMACTITVEAVASREEALALERGTIKTEKPKHNVVHNPPKPRIMPEPGVITSYVTATKMRREDVAKAAKISRQSLHKIENGLTTPRIEIAARLARAIGCPVEVLRPDLEGILK